MSDLFFQLPQQILFGPDTINRIGSLLSPLGKRAILVTEAILYEQKTIDKVQELLLKREIEAIVYDEVVPNATSTCVDEGVRLARNAHVDLVIGLGGVKTLSIAKCIAMVTPGRLTMDDYLSGDKPDGQALTYVELPTTCRNPFMMQDSYLMIDARDRTAKIAKAQAGITHSIIIDPKLCDGLPPKYTATTILDTLLHAFEGYISTKSNFFSDSLFHGAIELLGGVITSANEKRDEVKARTEASKAGFLTALGLTMSSCGLGTALSYAINARFMIPKSWVATILIPYVMEFNSGGSTQKITLAGKLLGIDIEESAQVEAAEKTIETIRTIINSLKLPNRLRDFDLQLEDMAEIAETAHSFEMINHLPRTSSTEEIYDIIKSAF